MLKSLVIAFSTFSKIPMPRTEWTRESMRYSVCFFPMVGAVVGAAEYLIFLLSGVITPKGPFPLLLIPMLLTAAPLLITGGIHLDGFLDTTDALLSYRSAEEKVKILKDPHVGAFAVIYGMIYMLVTFGLMTCVDESVMRAVGAGYVLTRAMSGWAITSWPKARKDGMVAMQADSSAKACSRILFAEMLVAAVLLVAVDPVTGGAALVAALLMLAIYYRTAMKEFGGVSGDVAGWFVELAELLMLAAAVAVELIR